MKKVSLYLFCLLYLLVPCCISAQEYSLDDLYRMALERSEKIKIAEEELYISKQEKARASAVLLPTLSAFGSHKRYTEEKRVASAGLLQPEYTNEWGIRLDQSVSLSGREITAFKIAKEGIRKSRFDLYSVKEGHLLNVAAAYYDVLKSRKAAEIAAANVERLTKHRDAAKKRLEVGEATKTVLLRAEAELSSAQSDKIKSENVLSLAKSILAKTVGIRGPYELKEPYAGAGVKGSDRNMQNMDMLNGECRMSAIGCLKAKALSERAEIKTMELQKEIAENEVKYAKGAYWPDLSIEGVYYRQDNDPSTSFEIEESVYGGVKLNFPFFEGGLRIAEVRKAKAELRQTQYALSELKEEINVEVENSYLDLLTVSAVLEKLRAEVKYALDNFNAVTKQFKYGLADSIDVMDANTLLVTAERELANAGYEYDMAVLRLKRSTGVLLKDIINNRNTAD